MNQATSESGVKTDATEKLLEAIDVALRNSFPRDPDSRIFGHEIRLDGFLGNAPLSEKSAVYDRFAAIVQLMKLDIAVRQRNICVANYARLEFARVWSGDPRTLGAIQDAFSDWVAD